LGLSCGGSRRAVPTSQGVMCSSHVMLGSQRIEPVRSALDGGQSAMDLLRRVLVRLDSIDLRLDELQASMCVVERSIDENGVQVTSVLSSLRGELTAAVQQAAAARGAARQSGAAVEALNRRLLALGVLLVTLSVLNNRGRSLVSGAVRRVSTRSLVLTLFTGLMSVGVAQATESASRRLPLLGVLMRPLAASRPMQLATYGGAICIYAAAAGLPWKFILAAASGDKLRRLDERQVNPL